jgi:hypothetical protein
MVRYSAAAQISLFAKTSTSVQGPIQWVSGAKQSELDASHSPIVVLKLRIRETLPPLLHTAHGVVLKSTDNFTFILLLLILFNMRWIFATIYRTIGPTC